MGQEDGDGDGGGRGGDYVKKYAYFAQLEFLVTKVDF
jgi:hypothetical protein